MNKRNKAYVVLAIGAGAVVFVILINSPVVSMFATEKGRSDTPNHETSRVFARDISPPQITSAQQHVRSASFPSPVVEFAQQRLPQIASLPSINARLTDIYSELRRRADSGDKHAACRLGFELDRCEAVRRAGADIPQHLKAAVDVCSNFKLDYSVQSWQYVLAAAEAGHTYSAVRFSQGMGLVNASGLAEKVDGWVAYRQSVFPLLERAAASGSPQAVYMLAQLYNRPRFDKTLPTDSVKSLGYFLALKQVSSPDFQITLSSFIDEILNQPNMRPVDIDRAAEFAKTITPTIRGVPPTGLDFGTGSFKNNDGTECNE